MAIEEGTSLRRPRARRGVEQRRRGHPRPHRTRRRSARPGARKVYILDEVHMLVDGGVERAAEDARGAARPRRVRAGHHRSAEGAAHHPQPHPALRVAPAVGRRARRRWPSSSSPTPGSTSAEAPSTTSCAPAAARPATCCPPSTRCGGRRRCPTTARRSTSWSRPCASATPAGRCSRSIAAIGGRPRPPRARRAADRPAARRLPRRR